MTHARADLAPLLELAAAGDADAWGALLMSFRARLTRVVAFRLDPRLRGRVDPDDVVQEAYAQAVRPPSAVPWDGVALFVWLRGVVANKLLEVHRHHLGAQMRDAGREDAAPLRPAPDATSVALLEHLSKTGGGPGTAAAGAEVAARLRAAVDAMDPADREILALRHYEQLTGAEAAHVLGIRERAAAKRYVRALQRLRAVLAEMPGGLAGLGP